MATPRPPTSCSASDPPTRFASIYPWPAMHTRQICPPTRRRREPRSLTVHRIPPRYAMHPDWIDVRDNWGGSTALIEAAASSHCPNSEVVDFLLGVGADVGVMDDLGNQALHHAAMRGHVTIIQTLLDAVSRLGEVGTVCW